MEFKKVQLEILHREAECSDDEGDADFYGEEGLSCDAQGKPQAKKVLSVGNLVVFLGVAMGAGLAWATPVLVSQFCEHHLLLPWADCSAGTSELIGEDLPVIIRLECQQVNELD